MNKGFTLAEVLITLGIIGVVAALTMPALIANSRKTEYSSRLKKFYSMMEQAIIMSELDNGQISDWVRSGDSQLDEDGDYDFEANGNENNEKTGENTTIHLADGSTISLFNGSCIDVIFDTNGNVPPNESARDQFRFLFCLNKTDQIGHCGKENKVFCTYGLNNTSSRATILNTCKTNTAYCSRLLQIDGWEFKKDYPHRL